MQKFQQIQKTGITKNHTSKNYEKIRKINMILCVFKTALVGVVTTRAADEFAAADRQQPERCEKCGAIGKNFVKKT